MKKKTAPYLLMAFALAMASCASSTPSVDDLGPQLPFHVAVAPIQVEEFPMPLSLQPTKATAGDVSEEAKEDEENADLTIDVSAAEIAQALQKHLDRHCFVDVTVLEVGEGDPELVGPAGLHDAETSERWQREAREQGADLLMTAKMLYDPRVDAGHNEKFWLNLPLFLLGGPFCWFVDDCSYDMQVELQVDFYDISSVRQANLAASRWKLLPVSMQVEFQEASFDFNERVDGSVPMYGASIIIPAGFLKRGGDSVEELVEKTALEAIALHVANKVHQKKSYFEQNSNLASFYVEFARLRSERIEGERVALAIPVVHPYGEAVRGEFALMLNGSTLLEGRLDELTEESGVRWLQREILLPTDVESVDLQLRDFSNNTYRSFTLPVIAQEGEPAS